VLRAGFVAASNLGLAAELDHSVRRDAEEIHRCERIAVHDLENVARPKFECLAGMILTRPTKNGVSIMSNTLEAQKALLRDLYGRGGWECRKVLDELDATDELHFDSVSQIKMQNWSRGRVALVGDAAFCVSLLAGQGSALAMIAAYMLAGELSASQGRYQQAFASYEARLRSYIDAKQRGAERFAGAFALRTEFPQFSHQGLCHPGSRKACGRQGYCGSDRTPRISMARARSVGCCLIFCLFFASSRSPA
jgi:FAD binding domain